MASETEAKGGDPMTETERTLRQKIEALPVYYSGGALISRDAVIALLAESPSAAPPSAVSVPAEDDVRCILCGDPRSKHTKSPADWRTVPGCSKFTAPLGQGSPSKE